MPRTFGEVDDYDDCSADEIEFQEDILRYGRIAAGSDAFEQCIDDYFNGIGGGPYRACDGEPFATSSLQTQIDMAVEMARSPNDLDIRCEGGGGNASTGQNSGWGHTHDEGFSWGGWFADVLDQMNYPVCGPGESPPGCRFAAYPWPYDQAAGITWHEAAHTHGYSHGANSQASAINNCGYAGDPTWHYQVNTAPYLIGNCVSAVLDQSGDTCGNIDSCPGTALRIVDEFGGTTCSCREDPTERGFATFEYASDEFEEGVHLSHGTWAGGWNFGNSSEVQGFGDFDGDGEDEVLMMSNWGMAILGKTSWGSWTSEAIVQNGTWIGGWNFGGSETIEAIGDFDGDGIDEFVIRSGWGLGILQKSGSGFSQVWGRSFNNWVGSYYMRSGDTVIGAGNFSSTTREDLLVHGQYGSIGILQLSGSAMTTSSVNHPGNWMGGWNHGSSNTISLPADYDGDGLDEFVIRSGWGVGIVDRTGSGSLTTIETVSNGTALAKLYSYAPGSTWVLDASDQLLAAGDMGTDGRAELVVRNGSGIGLLTLDSSNNLRTRRQAPWGERFSGGWLLGSNNSILGMGNYDGITGDDILIRSPWGIGVISLWYYNYTPITGAHDDWASMMGEWYSLSGDEYVGNADFDGDGIEEFALERL